VKCKRRQITAEADLLVLAVQLVHNIRQGKRQGTGVKQRAYALLRAAASDLKNNNSNTERVAFE
jgi:hypothetical protein